MAEVAEVGDTIRAAKESDPPKSKYRGSVAVSSTSSPDPRHSATQPTGNVIVSWFKGPRKWIGILIGILLLIGMGTAIFFGGRISCFDSSYPIKGPQTTPPDHRGSSTAPSTMTTEAPDVGDKRRALDGMIKVGLNQKVLPECNHSENQWSCNESGSKFIKLSRGGRITPIRLDHLQCVSPSSSHGTGDCITSNTYRVTNRSVEVLREGRYVIVAQLMVECVNATRSTTTTLANSVGLSLHVKPHGKYVNPEVTSEHPCSPGDKSLFTIGFTITLYLQKKDQLSLHLDGGSNSDFTMRISQLHSDTFLQLNAL